MSNLGPVANQFPTRPSPYRIAFIGEAPGADEVRLGYPFAGTAGWLFNSTLSTAALSREEVFVGNVCQHRPSTASNDFALLPWEGEEVQKGIAQLLRDLETFRPNLVVCLGNVPLHLFKQGNVPPPRTDAGYQWPSKVTAWRGSLFLSSEQLWAPRPSCQLTGNEAPCPSTMEGALPSPTPGSHPLALPTGAESIPGQVPPSANDSAANPEPPGQGEGSREVCCPPAGGDPRASNAGSPPTFLEEEVRTPSLLVHQTIHISQAIRALQDPQRLQAMGWDAEELKMAVHRATPRYKCLSTLHPAFVLRAWTKLFDLRMDFLRAREEGRSPVLTLDELDIRWGPENPAVT